MQFGRTNASDRHVSIHPVISCTEGNLT
ncbi:hypothetical protein NOCARDAX2BIS_250006 [Nocardioides sp. AX2bis]|nr:hypothetical protein NOCARDAX2BIS_250006 [Nocardioides sp. AX2bis]